MSDAQFIYLALDLYISLVGFISDAGFIYLLYIDAGFIYNAGFIYLGKDLYI